MKGSKRVALGVLLLGLWPTLRAQAEAAPTVRIVVRVAACSTAGGERAPVRERAWIDAHVEAVRGILAPLGVALEARVEPFTPSRCVLLDAADRDALAVDAVARPGEVPVLLVERVRDLDVPTYDLNGVHWRAPDGRRWIFLTAKARPPVLAHELCHFFGLPHDPAGGNLMTPGPSSASWSSPHPPAPFQPVLTPPQRARLVDGVRRYARPTR